MKRRTRNQRRRRRQVVASKRSVVVASAPGSINKAPRPLGVEQPGRLLSAPQIHTIFRGYGDLTTSALGTLSVSLNAHFPLSTTFLWTQQPQDLVNFQASFSSYKVSMIQLTYTPIVSTAAVLGTMISAYFEGVSPVNSISEITATTNTNAVMLDPRRAFQFSYRIRPLAYGSGLSLNPNINLMSGGWIATQALTSTALGDAGSSVVIRGSGYPQVVTTIGRLVISFKIKFRGRD